MTFLWDMNRKSGSILRERAKNFKFNDEE